MSRRMWGLIFLLIGSEAIGLLLGEWFHRLFEKTVPPLAMSTFNQGAAHVAFIFYGAIAGLLIFGWSLVTGYLGPLFKSQDKAA